jgi:hypothetical protein
MPNTSKPTPPKIQGKYEVNPLAAPAAVAYVPPVNESHHEDVTAGAFSAF